MLAVRQAGTLLLAALAAGCATTGSTLGSGVGDRGFDHGPFYAGATTQVAGGVAHRPIGFQRGATQPPSFEPPTREGGAIAGLLADMNAYLKDRIGGTVPITMAAAGTAPDVRFGCPADATGDCLEQRQRDGSFANEAYHLAVGRPSSSWISAMAAALDSASAGHVLVISLEVGQYWVRQRDVAGNKEVELGTDYSVAVPWLTSLDQPVQVLQLTGALIGRDGKAVRIGAEGLFARPTPLVASGFGAQSLIREEDVQQLRTLRRTDFPGQPLVWEVALRVLVNSLMGRRAG